MSGWLAGRPTGIQETGHVVCWVLAVSLPLGAVADQGAVRVAKIMWCGAQRGAIDSLFSLCPLYLYIVF